MPFRYLRRLGTLVKESERTGASESTVTGLSSNDTGEGEKGRGSED